MKEALQDLLNWKNSISPSDVIQICLAIVTLFVTINIPIQIMKFQRYQNLVSTYMSFEFAHAFQSVIRFFHDDCGCDVERIKSEYKRRFEKDMKSVVKSDGNNAGNPGDILHYQRRFLNNFFLELEMCRESSWIIHRRIIKEWTSNEAWIVKILLYMDKAVAEDKEMFQDISSIKHERLPKTKGMCEYLEKFYKTMNSQPDFMRL